MTVTYSVPGYAPPKRTSAYIGPYVKVFVSATPDQLMFMDAVPAHLKPTDYVGIIPECRERDGRMCYILYSKRHGKMLAPDASIDLDVASRCLTAYEDMWGGVVGQLDVDTAYEITSGVVSLYGPNHEHMCAVLRQRQA